MNEILDDIHQQQKYSHTSIYIHSCWQNAVYKCFVPVGRVCSGVFDNEYCVQKISSPKNGKTDWAFPFIPQLPIKKYASIVLDVLYTIFMITFLSSYSFRPSTKIFFALVFDELEHETVWVATDGGLFDLTCGAWGNWAKVKWYSSLK